MDNTSEYLSGNVRIDLNLFEEYENELVFDFKSDMNVDSVKVNGIITSYLHSEDLIIINYNHIDDYNENYMVSAEIFYHGSPSDGMFNEYYWYNNVYQFTYSLSEPYSAKYWFPCKQVLTDKADSSYFYVTIPENLKAGSNGVLKNEVDLGSGMKRMEWQSSYPIDYYLISVAVAKYQDYSFIAEIPNYSEQIFIQNFIPDNATYLNENVVDIEQTTQMLQLLSDKFGLYPFYQEKFGHCIVPLNGGMEHQTMTTLGNFDFELVIHELSHSWFGDYVTCASWQDIWINEGFASYGEYIGYENLQGESSALAWLEECQSLSKEATTGSVFVPFEELSDVNRIFDYNLSYRKGAYLVHMIRYIINDDELFFTTLREYVSTFANETATAEDFKAYFETETSIDFDPFFEQWYYGEGYPIYSVIWWQTDDILNVEMTQTTTASIVTPLFTIPMEFKVMLDDDTDFNIRKDVESNFSVYQIPVSGTVTDVVVNPDLAVLADVSAIHSEIETKKPDLATVFPNPSDGRFNIYTEKSGNCNVKLCSSDGKLISEYVFSGNSDYVDFDWLNDGIYFLNISGEGKNSTIKLIITK